MNARDIIKLAAQLYVYDALKKKITILTNIQKGYTSATSINVFTAVIG